MGKFNHNSILLKGTEPSWSDINKNSLPDIAFADKPKRRFPHHWVTNNKLYLHKGGLNAAWAAAMGARSGVKAEQFIISHLDKHRKKIKIGEYQNVGGNIMQKLIIKSATSFKKFDFKNKTIPMEIGRTGIGTISDGAEILWTEDMLDRLMTVMTNDDSSRKVYLGHKTFAKIETDGDLHRDMDEWVGTLQGNLRKVDIKIDGNTEKALIDDLLIHGDNEKSKMLLNRVKEVPEQIFGSLHFACQMEPVKYLNAIVEKIIDVVKVFSYDIVPNADFGKIYNPAESNACKNEYAQNINNYLREVRNMDFDKFKELHSDEAEKAIKKIEQSAIDFFKKSNEYKELTQSKVNLEKANKTIEKLSGTKNEDKEENHKIEVLTSKLEKLETELKEKDKMNKSLEKKQIKLQIASNKTIADKIIEACLVEADLPEIVQTKIKNQYKPDISLYLDNDGDIETDKYTDVVKKEIESWLDMSKEIKQSVGHGAGEKTYDNKNEEDKGIYADDEF